MYTQKGVTFLSVRLHVTDMKSHPRMKFVAGWKNSVYA